MAGADVIFTGLGKGDRGGLPLVDLTGFIGRVATTRELSRKIFQKKTYYCKHLKTGLEGLIKLCSRSATDLDVGLNCTVPKYKYSISEISVLNW